MKIATINIGTLRDKEEKLIDLMKQKKVDILGLCATRVKGIGTKMLHDNYHLMYSGGHSGQHGVGLIVSEEISQRVGKTEFKNDRILSLSLKLNNNFKTSII